MYHPGSCEGELGCLFSGNKVKFCLNPMNRKSQWLIDVNGFFYVKRLGVLLFSSWMGIQLIVGYLTSGHLYSWTGCTYRGFKVDEISMSLNCSVSQCQCFVELNISKAKTE